MYRPEFTSSRTGDLGLTSHPVVQCTTINVRLVSDVLGPGVSLTTDYLSIKVSTGPSWKRKNTVSEETPSPLRMAREESSYEDCVMGCTQRNVTVG